MGHEAKLQAVPIDHPFVREWLSASADPGEQIQQMFFRFGEMRRGMNPEPFFALDAPEYQAYQRRILAMAQQYPWLVAGFIDLDRQYDYVIYMLELGAENDRDIELARATVIGFEQIAGMATASQGRPIHWSTPDQVVEIYKFLKRLDKKKTLPPLAIENIPPDRYMYKRFPDSLLDDTMQKQVFENSIYSCFRPLLKFYQGARQNGFGIIAVRD